MLNCYSKCEKMCHRSIESFAINEKFYLSRCLVDPLSGSDYFHVVWLWVSIWEINFDIAVSLDAFDILPLKTIQNAVQNIRDFLNIFEFATRNRLQWIFRNTKSSKESTNKEIHTMMVHHYNLHRIRRNLCFPSRNSHFVHPSLVNRNPWIDSSDHIW